jgi:hypothetical protein
MGQVEDSVTQHNHQFLMLTSKSTRERVILCFYEATFPGPLPELCLRGPKLLAIAANHQRRFLFLFLFLFLAQFDPRFVGRHFDLRISPFQFEDKESCKAPEGEASNARRCLRFLISELPEYSYSRLLKPHPI